MAPTRQTTQRSSKGAIAPRRRASTTSRIWFVVAIVAVGAVVGLYMLFRAGGADPNSSPGAAGAAYAVGAPGPGEQAPNFTLSSTGGDSVSLNDYRGKSVLLYFHEGLGCQPCWDQIRDLEKVSDELKAAGIDELVTITSGPADLIGQKMADDGLDSVALADVDLAVSQTYTTNKYGMMGDSRNGHTFILVGPDGRIEWRADYGGAPDYTMYVPVPKILADLEAGRVDA